MAGKKISELQALTTLTGEEELPVAIGGGNRKVTSSLLVSEIKTAQSSLLTRVNDYMYDMSGLLGKLAYRDGIGTDEKNVSQEDGYYDTRGKLKIQSAGFVYQKLQVYPSKIYRIRQMVGNYPAVSALVLFDEHDEIISTVPYNYPSASSDKYFVFAGVHSVGISFVKSDNNSRLESFDIQDLTTVINTQQGNRALYVAAGAVYNKQTGFYELNGLTDITEEQMREIYVKTNEMDKYNDLTSSYPGAKIRANLGFYENTYRSQKSISIFNAFRGSQFEVLKLGANSLNYWTPVSNVNSAFTACRKLTRIIGVLDFSKITSNVNYTFVSCEKLNSVFIKNLKISIPFSDSPLLSLESLQYLITNAANTSAITVTVHADVYDKIQDETNAEWHALIETAAAKQITFATA